MAASPRVSSRWRHYVLGAVCATLLSLLAWHIEWRWGAMLDNAAHDAGFRLRSPLSRHQVAEELPRSRDIVIIDLPHEIPRPLLARLVNHLSQARVVALDLMLVDRASQLSSDERPLFTDEMARWKAEDRALAGAMKKADNVVIGAWSEAAPDGTLQWVRPSPLFERSAHASTHLSVLPDAQDGIIRRLRLWENDQSASSSSPDNNTPTSLMLHTTNTSRSSSKAQPQVQAKPTARAIPALCLQIAALALGKTPAQIAPPPNERDLWINYLGPGSVMKDQSKYAVFERALNWLSPEDFKDKLVFVGETSFRSKDVFPTPCGDMPGLFLHAQATATLLDARGTPTELPLWGVALMTLLAALLLVAPLLRCNFTICALVAVGEVGGLTWCVAFLWANWNIVAPLSVPAFAVFLTYNGVALFEYLRARRTLGNVVGRTMLARLLEAPADPALGGKEEVATAFFCDLRGFSAWAQTRPPQQLIADLNAYTATVVQAVEAFGGRPIDFFGDGVFVLFEGPHHARRGVEAALAVSEALDDGVQTGLRAGVALHTGEMVIGLVGHAHHFKPGAVGEAVNIASRVQSLSEDCGFAVLMTRQTLEEWCRDEPSRESIPLVQPVFCGARFIKGYSGTLEVFGLKPLAAEVF